MGKWYEGYSVHGAVSMRLLEFMLRRDYYAPRVGVVKTPDVNTRGDKQLDFTVVLPGVVRETLIEMDFEA